MALIEINRNPSHRELRQFACIWLPAFAALVGGLLWYHFGWWQAAATLWTLALVAAVVGWLAPQGMRLVYLGWMYAALPIGWTVSHLLMAAVYYLLITPIGLVMRLVGRDSMQRRFDRSAATYWEAHAPQRDIARYFRQF
ncbi:MAG: SxtJ family membrane protein [Pirellulales bacterium]